MDDAGQKLKKVRERLGLRYRDVEEASVRLAERHQNAEFVLGLSRLADIENKGLVPSLFRLYSLCAIYKLDPYEVMSWYEVDLSDLAGDAAVVNIPRTHIVGLSADMPGAVQVPLSLDPGLDLRKTTYLSRLIQRWGRLPLMLLGGLDLEDHRYAYIGTEDSFMYPLLLPGALVMIDETRQTIANSGWTNEFERPIYFLEHREGYACGWCSLMDGHLLLQPHPASSANPEVYAYPKEIDVVGQVVGVAMRLDQKKSRRTRS